MSKYSEIVIAKMKRLKDKNGELLFHKDCECYLLRVDFERGVFVVNN